MLWSKTVRLFSNETLYTHETLHFTHALTVLFCLQEQHKFLAFLLSLTAAHYLL